MRVILLGTKGGPRVSATDCGPGHVLLSDDRVVLVDCGQGVPQQLLRAGIEPSTVTDIVITHHHSDHNTALGTVLMAAWAHGLRRPLHVHGPEPIERIVAAHLEANAYDIDIRVADEGRPDLRDLVAVSTIDGGETRQLGSVRMSAVRVRHAPVDPALAYRFDANGVSVVFSGDTGPSEELIALAAGADDLVHEVIAPELLRPFDADVTNSSWTELHRHLVESHTSVHDLGEIAQRAGVKRLTLSHIVPAATFDRIDWKGALARSFTGDIVKGTDLMEFTVGRRY